MPENMIKVVQLKDPTTKEPVSPVVGISSIYDNNGNNIGEQFTNPGLPVRDIRSFPIRTGESISAGDVVNVGAASDGEAETVYKDVIAQDNVENVIESTATTATAICKLNEEYSVAAFGFQGTEFHIALIRNSDGKYANAYASITAQNVSSVSLARLDDSHFVAQYVSSTNLYIDVFTVSGTSITKSSHNTVANSVSDFQTIIMLDSAHVFAIYNSSGLKMRAVYIQSTVTFGTVYSLSSNTGANYISACCLPVDSSRNKRVCICFSDTGDGNKGKAVIATIDSSNAVTFGDVVEIGGSTTTKSQIINCVANDTEIYMQFDTGLFVYDFSLISLSTRSAVSGTGNPYSGALVLCAEHSVAFINASRAYVFSFNGESLSRGDEFKYNDTSFAATWYMSAAFMDNNRVLLAYANPSNSNYGTTTILTVNGNQIAGSFLDNSQDAIALESGSGGDTIKVGFGGYCECPGVAAGDEIVGSGEDAVIAIAPKSGWLWVNPIHRYYSLTSPTYLPFSEASWEEIAEVSELGLASEIYNLGDIKDIALTGIGTMTLEIADFDHDYLSGSTSAGKAGISLITRDLLPETKAMNSTNMNVGGFPASDLYDYLNGTILNGLPSDLRSALKTTYKWYGTGNNATNGQWHGCKVWIPLEYEMFGTTTHSPATEHSTGNARKYPIFTDNASRIKRMNNGSGSEEWYWEASPRASNATYFCTINSSGGASNGGASVEYGVCFGLCV